MRALLSLVLSGSLLCACGGSKPPAAAPDAEAAKTEDSAVEGGAAEAGAAEEGDAEAETTGVPTKCVEQGGSCVPPQKWVARLCSGSFPGVTVKMFEKSSPWTRGYMRTKTDAVYASGGMSGDTEFVPGEEVIIIAVRKLPEDGMQVSGAGGWDVLRWDGTCATVSTGEMGLEPFGELKAAPVTYRYLDEPIRAALDKNPAVAEAAAKRRANCKGATMGTVTQECEKWDKKLSEAVVKAARDGIDLPEPEKLP